MRCLFYDNKILTRLAQKKIRLGTQSFNGSQGLVEILGATGFDFVMFDTEQSANNARAMVTSSAPPPPQGWLPYIRVAHPRDETT